MSVELTSVDLISKPGIACGTAIKYLISVDLISVDLISVDLISVDLISVDLIFVELISVELISVELISKPGIRLRSSNPNI